MLNTAEKANWLKKTKKQRFHPSLLKNNHIKYSHPSALRGYSNLASPCSSGSRSAGRLLSVLILLVCLLAALTCARFSILKFARHCIEIQEGSL